MATVWMDWAAKAVDRTAEFSSRERGLARSRSESWQPCSELAAMRRQSMTVAEVEDFAELVFNDSRKAERYIVRRRKPPLIASFSWHSSVQYGARNAIPRSCRCFSSKESVSRYLVAFSPFCRR
uniref:Uncharacterized protein n=1 Tax=Oryza sativa subsp. japonica TaxID=39947 RepID=Q6YUA5_ORYSJ|nr:hypothetical protein [Oryza sativa Japonica Group]